MRGSVDCHMSIVWCAELRAQNHSPKRRSQKRFEKNLWKLCEFGREYILRL